MDNKKITEITNAVYSLLEFFPKDEPLKNKAKEKALEIMENLVFMLLPDGQNKTKACFQVLRDIQTLKSYLDLAKSRGWIDNMNMLIVTNEYLQIEEKIRPLASKMTIGQESKPKIRQKTPVDNVVSKDTQIDQKDVLSKRQNKIIEMLNTQEKAQVADFKKILPEVSKRTLRRDLDELLKIGKVERVGEWNQVVYKTAIKSVSVVENKQDSGRTDLLS